MKLMRVEPYSSAMAKVTREASAGRYLTAPVEMAGQYAAVSIR